MFQELIDRRMDIECQHVCQLTASLIGEVLAVNEKSVGEVAAPNVVGPGRGHVVAFPSASWNRLLSSDKTAEESDHQHEEDSLNKLRIVFWRFAVDGHFYPRT